MNKHFKFKRKEIEFDFFVDFTKDVKFPYFNVRVITLMHTKNTSIYLTENTYKNYGIYRDKIGRAHV